MKPALNRRSNAGFSLVESLVALVVLSIGMLGIAALYVESLRSGRTALLRTQAVALAGDMADRIRANRSGAAAYGDAVASSATGNANCAPGGAGCSSADLARHDKQLWLNALETVLPGAVGTVVVDQTTVPTTYTITVTWSEVGQQDPNTYQMRIQT